MHQLIRAPKLENSGDLLLQVEDLSYTYPDGTPALEGVDLQLHVGERLALVGHNGSGKTTLIKQLCGLLESQQGRVQYKGVTLSERHRASALLEIGLLFQDPDDQLFGHSIYEDVAFGPRNQGLPEVAVDLAVRRAVASVGLEKLLFKPPHALSYGQKKRAALAGLLAMQPELLILDEPTANLDPAQQQIFINLLHEFRGTLILISHDLIFLYELCNRALVLNRGRVHHDSSIDALVQHRPSLREHGLDFSFRFAESRQRAAKVRSDRRQSTGTAETITPTGPASALIDTQSLHYRYPDGTAALRGINLAIDAGERVALVGENGAGKSTLLKCLLGLLPFSGQYYFGGAQITAGKGRPVWQQTGMVFQDCADQLVCPTCYDEVAFAPRQFGIAESALADIVGSALETVKLAGFEDRVPLHLSGGERKRLALASVLSLRPQLLILDEPSAGLDPQGEELLLNILHELDVTLLLVSHDIFFVRELTTRTLVIHHGQIPLDYSTKDFLCDKNLTTLNGLDYTYRDRCALEIRDLQHQHEHAHRHKHRHEHPHHHDELRHSHLHEHEHEHSHVYSHRHDEEDPHQHSVQSLYHDHAHPDHDPHEHDDHRH